MIYFILLLLGWVSPESVHDFHVSRLTMDYEAEEHHFEVALHVFTDDLELALQERGAPKLRLNTESEWGESDDVIISYLNDVLRFRSSSGNKIRLQYLGKEPSDDFMATWIYFYWKLPEDEDQFHLKHRLFHEIYDDQQNILKLKGCEPMGLRLLTSQSDEVSINCVE